MDDDSYDQEVEARPIINFNGMQQVGYMVPNSNEQTPLPSAQKKEVEGITDGVKEA